jgi:CRISPR/Cas system CSM-associated protein Csm4 (group 5 of RAMP superfamily)
VTYKVEMSLTGRLTQLPDSQRIFGALIYLYAEQYSSEGATLLVSKIREGEFYFSLSNILPRNYFPTPQTYLLDPSSGQPSDRSDSKKDKKTYRAIKDRSFMKLAEIYKAMDNPNHADHRYPFACIQSSQQIHAAIDSLRYDIPGLDPNVYSVPEVNVVEVLEEGKKEIVTEFSFYLCADKGDESAKLLDALHHAKESKRRFFLGAKASQGFNTFIVNRIHSLEWGNSADQPNTYLNLGMLLPQEINFNLSSLKLFTSERRPYDSAGGWGKEFSGQFISFIDAGSIVFVKEALKTAGCSIQSPFNSRDIVFGNAFLLPINIDRRKQHDAPSTS